MIEKGFKEGSLEAYQVIEAKPGREFIFRLNAGADVLKSVKKFVQDHNIRIAKICAFNRGSLQPTRFEVWTPDTANPSEFTEINTTIHNKAMVLSLSGIIHPKIKEGKEVTDVKIHIVIGGSWDVPTMGGHLQEGSITTGTFEFFVTEMTGIDILPIKEGVSEWYKPVT